VNTLETCSNMYCSLRSSNSVTQNAESLKLPPSTTRWHGDATIWMISSLEQMFTSLLTHIQDPFTVDCWCRRHGN